ncbi:uncharacterized protein LOC112464390 isoform X3 [Temnothorax curvispinosus]|uniref:Uncharacterized protein LOC112464390 isoform X3 n=1 Tax=Temnothorax curvispinosus TaxID=300111 RepID=A0A6J1QXR1_9HYME|nr:uncharacterized protein LOC112464390 isoform X3 [Temnothorax curvispinosus]
MVTRKRDAPPLMKRENFLRATESAKVRQPAKEAIPGKRENGQLENLTEPLQMEFFRPTGKSTESSGNVKTPISPSSSRNKEKKVAEVQKPVVEERQEEAGSKIELGTILNFNKEVASHMVEASDWKSDMLR